MEGLGDLPGGLFRSTAYGVSANGQIVVGESSSATSTGDFGTEAFKWTPDGGMVGLGYIGGNNRFSSSARAISSDGSVIVGINNTDEGDDGFRWTEQTGMVALTPPENHDPFSRSSAWGLADNGQWIVGTSRYMKDDHFIDEATLWDPQGVPITLGQLDSLGPISTLAHDVTDDGSIVVGTAQTLQGPKAFLWTPDDGIRSLEDVMLDYGFDADAEGWRLEGLSAITPDGHALVGWGLNSNGVPHTEAFLIRLPVPAPGTLPLLGLGCVGVMRRHRRGYMA